MDASAHVFIHIVLVMVWGNVIILYQKLYPSNVKRSMYWWIVKKALQIEEKIETKVALPQKT